MVNNKTLDKFNQTSINQCEVAGAALATEQSKAALYFEKAVSWYKDLDKVKDVVLEFHPGELFKVNMSLVSSLTAIFKAESAAIAQEQSKAIGFSISLASGQSLANSLSAALATEQSKAIGLSASLATEQSKVAGLSISLASGQSLADSLSVALATEKSKVTLLNIELSQDQSSALASGQSLANSFSVALATEQSKAIGLSASLAIEQSTGLILLANITTLKAQYDDCCYPDDYSDDAQVQQVDSVASSLDNIVQE